MDDLRFPWTSNSQIRTRVLTLGLVISIISSIATAQLPYYPPEYLDHARRVSGDSLELCVLQDYVLTDYSTAVAQELGDILLLDISIHEIDMRYYVDPLDYKLPLSREQIFYLLTNECQAFMGISLAGSIYPEWMTLTRSYLDSTFSLVTTEQEFSTLADIPKGGVVATRLGSVADGVFNAYINSVGDEKPWRRIPYPDFDTVVHRLLTGEVSTGIVWEPALLAATKGDLASKGLIRISAEPVQLPEISFGIALRSNDTFMRTLIDDALHGLEADGSLARLFDEFGPVTFDWQPPSEK